MKKYKYTAVNLQKMKFQGTFMAENEKDLAMELAQQNLYLISATPVVEASKKSGFWTLGGSVKQAEINTFCRQFAIMINSGISIIGAVSILRMQDYSAMFKAILDELHDDIKGGIMLSTSMEKHKNIFPDFFRAMIRVGEESGKLDSVLNSLADYYEADAAIKKKTKGAMTYPIVLLVMTLGILILMMAFIIPTFEDALASLETEMPPITKVIMNMSHWFTANWMMIVAGVALIILGLVILLRTEKGKEIFDSFKVNAPYLSTVTVAKIASKFARAFALLLSSGLDIVDSLEIIQVILGNRNAEKRFKKATEDIRQGMSLSMAFESYKLFPPIMIQMISVGEKTDSLSDVLTRSSKFFDEQAESALSALTAIIQPVILVFMGLTIGILFYAVYSPMLAIMTTVM